MTLPLFEAYPMLSSLPLAGIASVPTPVMALPETGDLPAIAVKRDDLTSPVYGGNKVRKLDLLLGDALAQERRTVLTFGAYGSNHALATAVHARAVGIEPHVVLSPQEPGPYAPRTLLAHAGLGTVIHLVDGWDGRREAVVAKQSIAARDGIEPYIIPMGGTCELGALGYVAAAFEFVAAPPDVVYVAAGTLGTAVGLAVGFAAMGAKTSVNAVRVTPLEICNEEIAAKLVESVCEYARARDPRFPSLTLGDLPFELRHDLFEPGYGIVTEQTLEALEIARSAGAPPLETTYTGKAMAALVADARSGRLSGHVVFWDTYNSAPYPAAGDIEALPSVLQEYIAECRRLFPEA